MNKKALSERDICTKYITPAVHQAGWDIHEQIREEYTFTDGRVIVRGNLTTRGKKKRADYILFHRPNFPIAVIEAKDNNHAVGAGMQQALEYASMLDIQFVYSSNGDGFIEHDMKLGHERELSLEQFPTPDELWQRYKEHKEIDSEQEELVTEPYYFALGEKAPRYYQRAAINRTIEAIAKGQKRLLLVMATGTGKTYTAFQIIWRLWKARKARKILYLADRNILIDQTIQNDFAPFKKVITKIEKRTLDSSYEIYMSLYHQLSGNSDEMEIFTEFSPDFFDLVIVDECHRGSARDNSRWRRILEYFESAAQLGLTATPKEDKDVSNAYYFGDPIYTYSLKQGIDDGFLAPYKVIRLGLDKDLQGYRPENGKLDKDGELIEDREYNVTDFDKTIVIDERTALVAATITDYLKSTNRFDKTIVFCVDIEHAERMRQALVNENQDLVAENYKYIMRITGDNPEGKAQLDNFIDPECKYPSIVTTSRLLTTGVDCQTCKLIVLDNMINSMTDFKQIIGRGSRLRPDYGKEFFTIMDFRNVSRLFADPDFDGDPIPIYNPDETEGGDGGSDGDTGNGPEGADDPDGKDKEKRKKIYVNNVDVNLVIKRVQYYDVNGKLITESLIDYSKKNILRHYATLDTFIRKWNSEDRKQAIIDELAEEGVLLEALADDIGRDMDPFDLICHIAFDKKPLTRQERVDNVKKRGYLYKYSETAQKVIDTLLDKYMNEGIVDLDDTKILELKPFDAYGNPLKIVREFGGKSQYIEAIKQLEQEIYSQTS